MERGEYNSIKATPIPRKGEDVTYTSLDIPNELIAINYDDYTYFEIAENELKELDTLTKHLYLATPSYKHSTTSDKIYIFLAIIFSLIVAVGLSVLSYTIAEAADAMVKYITTTKNETNNITVTVAENIFKEKILAVTVTNFTLGVLVTVSMYSATVLFSHTALNQTLKIRKLFLSNILNQDVGWYDLNQTGDFASRISDDLKKIQEGIGEKVPVVISYAAGFVIITLQALIFDWELALVCMVSLPVHLIAIGLMSWVTSKFTMREINVNGAAGAVAEEVFTAIRTVTAFGGEKKEEERYNKLLTVACNNNIKRSIYNGICIGTMWVSMYACYALGFWYGVHKLLADKKNYSVSTMVTVFFSISMGSWFLSSVMPYFEVFAMAKGAAVRIFDIIANKPVINASKNNGRVYKKVKGKITFENVHFSYPARQSVKVLNNFNLTINPGETVALVGTSGCGKSTCLQLIQRFYDPEYGNVLIDNHNLTELDLSWIRSHIGVVGQEPILFDTTIEENIRLGCENATQKDIEAAAKKANAHNFINAFPQKYKTLVGQRGTQLSGGQKQRIAIARALVRKPSILLLDEATSALDSTSEAIVQAALDAVSTECTTIIVAHRLSTIKQADKIVVMSEGQIQEEGTHQELLQKKGAYFAMVIKQIPQETLKEKVPVQENLNTLELDDEKFVKSEEKPILPKADQKHLNMFSIWPIVKYNLPEWWAIALGCVCSLINGAGLPVYAIIFGRIMRVLVMDNADYIKDETMFYCYMFLTIAIVLGLASVLQTYTFGLAGEKLTMRLRSKMFQSYLSQDMSYFDQTENSVGTLCSNLSEEAANVQGIAVEAINQIRTVASLGCEKRFYELYLREISLYKEKFNRNSHYHGIIYGLARGIIFFAYTVILFYGSTLIINSHLEYYRVLLISEAMTLSSWALGQALAFTPNFQKGVAAANRISHILNKKPLVRHGSNNVDQTWKYANVQYKNVRFSYPSRPKSLILKDFDMQVFQGKVVALVGASGCGKSTVVQLLERFYDPAFGVISVDNTLIQDMHLSALRSQIGVVSQEPVLFSLSIADNISYGDNTRVVPENEIIEAARKANIHDFIVSLPLGYDTKLGEKGTQLSGGQKQRIAIARALIRNPKILLLDEATSALDSESEKIVQEALDNAKIGRTCIVIAHRLNTIQDADLICVISRGEVVEMGTHSELLNLRGLYHNFCSCQHYDLKKIQEGIGEKVPIFISYTAGFVVSTVQALIVGWEVALVCMVSLPLNFIAIGFTSWVTSKFTMQEMNAYGAAGAVAEEVFSAIRTVTAFGGEKREEKRYNRLLTFACNNNIKRSFYNGVCNGTMWLSMYACYALGFWYGVQKILADQQNYSVSTMITVFLSISMSSWFLSAALPYFEIFAMAKGACVRIFEIIGNKPVINASKNNGTVYKKVQGKITFENVYFSYPARLSVEVLNRFNLTINPGETVALVGTSGCGKSTCIQLIQRYYDPQFGNVLIDNHNLAELDLSWIRSHIGVVGQEPILFDTTIAENIRLGCENATQKDIEAAAKQANAHDFIEAFPQKYETLVGQRGTQLSGGQKQRIAIARALVRKPSILLLDEATSALDSTSETIVQAALDVASTECTTIIVAHRLSTIKHADKIVVMSEGQIQEEGTHQDLLQKKGAYFAMVMAQIPEESLKDKVLVQTCLNTLELNEESFVKSEEKVQNSISSKDSKTYVNMSSIWPIIKYNLPEWWAITLGCICSLVNGAANPIYAILFGKIMKVLAMDDVDYIQSETSFYCYMFLTVAVVLGLGFLLQTYMFGLAGEKLTMRLRSKMFQCYLSQDMSYFDHTENSVGILCANLSEEAANVQGATGQRISTILTSVSTVIFTLCGSFYFEWRITLASLCVAPIIVAVYFWETKLVTEDGDANYKSLQYSTKIAVEAINQIRTVASLGCEKRFYEFYLREISVYQDKFNRNSHYHGIIYGLGRGIIFFAYAVILFYGAILIVDIHLEYYRVLIVSEAITLSSWSLGQALAFTPNFQKGVAAANRISQILNKVPLVRHGSNHADHTWKYANVQYKSVNFSYPSRPKSLILKDFDMQVFQGKVIALVGASGCGKSTVVQLLERFYDPSFGVISVDNTPIQEMHLSALRSQVGVVSQEPVLFTLSIADNISYGDNTRVVPRNDIIEAARKANIHDFIVSLPLGYDTKLGEKGTQLSGGQKQRIAIARALIRNPKILLLDEATSALDSESEKIVQEALDNAKKGRTCIIIAHRLNTIQDADLICVINRGEIAEMGIVAFVGQYAAIVLFSHTGSNQTLKIRDLFFDKILNQDIGWYDLNQTGDFASRVADDLKKIEEGIGDKVAIIISHIVVFVTCVLQALILSWELAVVCLASLPINLMTIGLISWVTSKFTIQEVNAYGAAGVVAEETLSSIRTVVAFGGEQKEEKRYNKLIKLACDVNIKRSLYNGICVGATWVSVYASYALGFWYGVRQIVVNEDYNVRVMLTVLFSITSAAWHLTAALPFLEMFAMAKTAAVRIFDVIASEPIINVSKNNGITYRKFQGQIAFQNVCFSYPSRRNVQVLKDFNLTINPGETIALVGCSGCGKSTFTHLLQRFYDPNFGNVLIDGYNIADLDLTWMRSHVGVVRQEPVLFDTTIAENIKLGRENATQEDIEAAAKKSNAHNFIESFPQKYETMVGQRGLQLSGGQKQRIAIARALVREPSILILDEATSALDATSEEIVLAALKAINTKCTTIIITHKLSTIKQADRIVIISEGQVQEEGSHEELVQKKGVYFDMVMAEQPQRNVNEGMSVPTNLETSESVKEEIVESKENTLESDIPKIAVEAINEIRTVASLGCEKRFYESYIQEISLYLEQYKRNCHYHGFTLGMTRALFFFSYVVIFFYGSLVIINDHIEYYCVLIIAQNISISSSSLGQALAFAPNFQEGVTAAYRITKILNKVSLVCGGSKEVDQTERHPNVDYKNVHFSYPSRPKSLVLNDFTMKVNPGNMVALVGANGCGKSTVIHLLERFYDPTAGTISIDNTPLHEMRLSALRSQLSIVSQEPVLFSISIADNISYGDNTRVVPKTEIIEAARLANIHEFIVSMPLGYDTKLGEKGTQLSGGQKQRIAIARALIRNPRLLLLDEATSALDSESEKIVQEALDNAKQGRTCIIISHRLNTIQNADLICVINQGQIVEMGTHFELLNLKGLKSEKLTENEKEKIKNPGKTSVSYLKLITSKFTIKEIGAYGAAGVVAEEIFSSIRTVVAFGGEEKEEKRYNKLIKFACDVNIKRSLYNGICVGTMWVSVYASYALGFWYGVQKILVNEEDYNVRVMVTVLFSITTATWHLTGALPYLEIFAMAKTAAVRIFDVIASEPVINASKNNGVTYRRFQGHIAFQNVYFSYPSRRGVQVLKDFNLVINPGETIALVGCSGCGKSTFTQLVQRFYDPDFGNVLIDGYNLAELDLTWMRSHVGVVSQEPVLFDTTIAENIKLGRENATQEDIETAAKKSNAHNFIENFPQKYETVVGQRGLQLSGGQKQRIAIARALVREPSILLLDEATSAIDATSEAIVLAALNTTKTKCTTIIITHKLSTIKQADRIVVISEGQVQEEGSHLELVQKKGVYYGMVMAQQPQKNVKEGISVSTNLETSGSVKEEIVECKENTLAFDIPKTAVEAINEIRTIASLGCEKRFYKIYIREISLYLKQYNRNCHYHGFIYGMTRALFFFSYAIILYYGSLIIINDHIEYYRVLIIAQSISISSSSLGQALAFTPNFQKGVAAANRITKILNKVPLVRSGSKDVDQTEGHPNVDYKKVQFSYPSRPKSLVLNDFTMEVIQGKMIALVGANGCGKSTIMHLLERFYDPTSGSISIDNTPLHEMRLSALRSQLGIVSQEPVLFSISIADNISYGDNTRVVPRTEIIEAARLANIHEFIVSMPLGYDTKLGEKGTQLSGGQKQRIAIARALIRNPRILLLDEATSALDSESEKIVQEALDIAKQGRTCIIISHRLNTIQDADLICVINQGQIVEMGSHFELLNLKGLYHSFYNIGWYDLNQTGDFASRVADDLKKIEEGIGEKVPTVISYVGVFVTCVLQAVIIRWDLALVCMVSLPINLISMGLMSWVTSKFTTQEINAYGAAGAIAEEVFSAIRTVVAFGGEKKESKRYNALLKHACNINIKRSFYNGICVGTMWLSMYTCYALGFWYSIKKFLEDIEDYNVNVMVTIFLSISIGTWFLTSALPYLEIFGMAKGAAVRIFDIIASDPVINASKGNGITCETVKGKVTFKDICFSYPSRPETKVLKNFNLTINPGETVALVGSSGCGKSTCVQLVQRYYDPEFGSVLIDDSNLAELDLTWIRSHIGVVSQEPALFDTTIAENIRLGCENATQEDIEAAAKKSNAHNFIETFPEKYKTFVGQRGTQLSGGQKQRIAIARALVRKPSILLLDEATSALDASSEAIVQEALNTIRTKCTTIIIAHRLSTIKEADRIVVIVEGQIQEEGTHYELIQKKGAYYAMVMAQLSHEDVNKELPVSTNLETEIAKKETAEIKENTPSSDLPKVTPQNIFSIWSIIKYNSPEWWAISLGCISSLANGACTPVYPIIFGQMMNVLVSDDSVYIQDQTDFYSYMFLAIAAILGLSALLQTYMFGIAGEKLTICLRSKMFQAYLSQDISYFDNMENSVGTLCANLSKEAANVQGATGQRIGTILTSFFTVIFALGISFMFEWRVTLVSLCCAPFLVGVYYLKTTLNTQDDEKNYRALQYSTKIAVEAINEIRTVASLGCEKRFYELYVREITLYQQKSIRNSHCHGIIYGLSRALLFCVYAINLLYGSVLIINDHTEFYRVLIVTEITTLSCACLGQALTFTPNFQKGVTAANRIIQILNQAPLLCHGSKHVEPTEKHNVEYDNVQFSYPLRPSSLVLKDFTIEVFQGKMVALVGPSGCGKSTVVQLLQRFYDPTSGSISLDSTPIHEMHLSALRSQLGVVSQEPVLFSTSIADNISYGDNARIVSQTEIIEAARKANIHDFITSLPLGYDTKLGEKGSQLSGGQKQRIAIARALVRNPKILLLDEATSALDSESEKIVQQALDNAKQGRTCIIISHRLNTIQDADLICVINQGQIVEMGSHFELLNFKGLYHSLYNNQLK
ncbi:hypothetical protein RN001_015239 [Aquatica leii]|uniref:ABC-type xenobiotic transporter n=1 Tax=Aquatica leii TaxID=1421715 RepID=A0AAN7SNG0_9COLE|nr:hypothetical protein RN001_015239 [Aquatica leii]